MTDLTIPEQHKDRAPLEKPLERITSPFKYFIQSQSSTGIVLLLATIIALALANSEWKDAYKAINSLPLFFGLGEWQIEHSLHHWVNDGLMVLFFFMLGMEIKREVIAGELSDIKQSGLVILMALGGMVMPASVYALVALTSETDIMRGWGMSMATDTAFAIGLLALLGSRAPKSAVVLLSALAIVDDIGAVLVISIFYTDNIQIAALINAAFVLLLLFIFNVSGIRKPIFYIAGGLALWWFILHSGVHATTAGILAALMVPTKPYAGTEWFIKRMQAIVNKFEQIDKPDKTILEQHQQHELTEKAKRVAIKSTTPLQHWTTRLDKPVSLAIMPLFAFLNAGVTMPEQADRLFESPLLLAIAAGLVIGKSVGIAGFAWIGLTLGWVSLPKDMRLPHIIALAFLAGIGFTMSLFIGALAFESQPELLAQAKMGVILGSLIAGTLGVSLFIGLSKQKRSQSS